MSCKNALYITRIPFCFLSHQKKIIPSFEIKHLPPLVCACMYCHKSSEEKAQK